MNGGGEKGVKGGEGRVKGGSEGWDREGKCFGGGAKMLGVAVFQGSWEVFVTLLRR